MRVRFILAAHPDHPLHKLGRKLSMQDLRAHRQLVVRESSPRRATPLTMEATQRWTVSNLATSIEAARSGHGFSWLPEERIREELKAGTLKVLPLREGGERYAELYLIFADREHAGPATLRLAEIIREAVASECKKSAVPGKDSARKRVRNGVKCEALSSSTAPPQNRYPHRLCALASPCPSNPPLPPPPAGATPRSPSPWWCSARASTCCRSAASRSSCRSSARTCT